MARNNIEMLTDFLFEEMERLNDIDLEEAEDIDEQMKRLDSEIKRAKQVGVMAKNIVAAGRAQLDAERFRADYTGIPVSVPKLLSD